MIKQAAVLGAGTMGVRIAAHLANAGIPVVLLDLSAESGKPSIAEAALQGLTKAKPAASYDPASLKLIQPGTFDHDLARLTACDWVIEAVIENLSVKQEILSKITPFLKPGVLLTTNTSGLPVASIAQHLSPRTPPVLVRHPLLQSAALHAIARSRPHPGYRPCDDRRHRRFRRPPSGQDRRVRPRHS